MPLYTFINIETGEEHEAFVKIADREQYLADNPHLKQKVGAPGIGDTIRLGLTKPDEGFRDILRDIKKGSGKGHEINTF